MDAMRLDGVTGSKVRIVHRWFASRAAKVVLLLLLAFPPLAWTALWITLVVTVHRANTLLAAIAQLKPYVSTYDDAMLLAHEYGSGVYFGDTPCKPKNCTFSIRVANDWPDGRAWLERDFLWSVGIRTTTFHAWVDIREGRVIGKGFTVWTEARKEIPFGQWLVVRTELTENFSQSFVRDFWSGQMFGLEEHPNRYVVNPHLSTNGGGQALDSYVSSDATTQEIARAFDYRLSCVSSLGGCSDPADLLPTAWEDHLITEAASHSSKDDKVYGLCPPRSLARLARDMNDVALVEVKKVFPVQNDQTDFQDVEFQLVQILKGEPDEHLPRFPMNIGRDYGNSQPSPSALPSTLFFPGNRMILFLKPSTLDFVPNPYCEVVPATEENVGIVRQTIDQASRAIPIAALRDPDQAQ
jgi:hypothetical protein